MRSCTGNEALTRRIAMTKWSRRVFRTFKSLDLSSIQAWSLRANVAGTVLIPSIYLITIVYGNTHIRTLAASVSSRPNTKGDETHKVLRNRPVDRCPARYPHLITLIAAEREGVGGVAQAPAISGKGTSVRVASA